MTEFSLSNTSRKTEFPSLLSDLYNFCFFAISHPLYFSYFIFFSPYLLKILSFLSPLFITTTLLLLAFLTAVSPNLLQEKSDSGVGCLLTVYRNVSKRFRSKVDAKDEESGYFVEFEAYKIIFETSIFEVLETESEEIFPQATEALDDKESNSDEIPVEIASPLEASWLVSEGKRLKSLLQEKIGLEDKLYQEEEEVKPLDTEFDKVEERKEKPSMKSGSKVMGNKTVDVKGSNIDDEEYAVKEKVISHKVESSFGSSDNYEEYYSPQTFGSNLGSFGSMRKEKEWRKTLACKLFEERHKGEGSEGMDMLWETYEAQSNKVKLKSNTKKGKKGKVEYIEDDEEEEEDMDGKLCCLKALKFSTGKMNLGMGRPNLLKFSKALKGIGWLHHVGSRHGKKGCH
ncbi:Acidic leucine-rich nuclear phosphoprotein 32 family B protein [Quillaja saponaria]|uniref:Acidic leucine-rich nuclear phosphoprotein 32 family B protein n=1 Tax=Quillaja saponaria TaxID=32244 RepID=A0AAD7L334_QUISA|nr:Acidic leucine-rich nuclear phosphoprotein 32 family B protein [Quillaja saponaria]KAJ7950482.1 Acidic leucine-rich nuclear phosphoprotein 32 family B protein [Quillaja saponaria]